MFNLNLFAVSSLLIVVSYIPLFFFIFTKGKTKVSKIYSLHILSILLWGCGSLLIATQHDSTTILNKWKFAYSCALFIPVFFYHAVYLITKNTNKLTLIIVYSQALTFLFLLLNDKVFISPRFVFNQFYFFDSSLPYLISVILWELVVLVAHIDILRFTLKKPRNKREIILLMTFTAVGFIGGTNNFLPSFGFDIYPYGNFLIPIHSFGISYAILKHRLFNIEFIFRKSIVYSILFTTITLLYLILVFLIEKTIQKFYGYTSTNISIIIVLVIGTISIPLRNAIQKIIDQVFLKRSHIEIVTENERLRQEITQTEKLKSIATFASGMAHEIKNPLTSIRIFCEYLPQKVHDKEFLNKFIPIVTREANRINELVHDLLDYAKPSPLDLRPNNIHKSMEDVLDALNAQIIDKKIKVIRDFNITITDLNFDNKQIKQALLNILLNAVEASPSNGNILISTQISDNKDAIIVKITDNGYGISKEDLPNIFDPFFTKKEKGTGLGLSITHGIIKEHGGKIFAESSLGQGTTFRIELPIRQS